MKVVVDVGNTEMKFGFFKEGSFFGGFRIATKRDTTSDELIARYTSLFEYNKIPPNGKTDVLISSVVPSVNRVLEKMFLRHFGARVFFLEASMLPGIDWNTDTKRMGSDRLINVASAAKRYLQPLVVVSLGTATTIDFLNKNKYEGGLILPGVLTSLDSLIASAERLSPIRLQPPSKLLGSGTEENINNGVYYLHREGIVGIIKNLYVKHVQEGELNVIFTGGISNFMNFDDESFLLDYIKVHNEPGLAIDGMHNTLKQLVGEG